MVEAAKQPIVIKRIKKGGHGHHGGAWKVAFADFVTAMMAFFMLMWLMGSTTPEQKAAIADFFDNPSAVPANGGASTSVIDLGGTAPEAPKGKGDNPDEQYESGKKVDEETAKEMAEKQERRKLESLLDELKEAIDASQALKPFKDQLLLDITNEGLRIQIIDKENRAMFASGSPVLQDYTKAILRDIVKVINDVPNKISISGHTDKTPYSSKNGYSNWELSADRANAARRELVAGGLPEEKLGRIVGLSSSVLFNKEDPFSPVNRRISIIVMNKATEESLTHDEGNQADAAESPDHKPPEEAAPQVTAENTDEPAEEEAPTPKRRKRKKVPTTDDE